MATSNIEIFNQTFQNAVTDVEYQSDAQRLNGVVPGIARSNLHNKLFRQTSVIAYAVGQTILNEGFDCLDTSPPDIVANLKSAIANIAIEAGGNDFTFAWQPDHAYEVGQVIFPTTPDVGQENGFYLECMTAGTSGATEPNWPPIGEEQSDGTVLWRIVPIVTDGIPVGTIVMYPATQLPANFMECDGSYLSKTAYPDLFEVIGTTYGEGMEADTFALPDLRGYFVRSLDSGASIDPNRTIGSVQGDAMRNITGRIQTVDAFNRSIWENSAEILGAFNALSFSSDNSYLELGNLPTTTIAGSNFPRMIGFDASRQVPTASENRPKNIAMVYAIKVYGNPINQGDLDISELADSVAQLTHELQQPAGSVLAFAGQTAPNGYLVANGQPVGRDTYPDLFDAIGTTYGEGDGSTTFNLPDFRGQFLRGTALDGTIDAGRTLGSTQQDMLRSHSHSFPNRPLAPELAGSSPFSPDASSPRGLISTTNPEGGTETRPTNVAILYCIKAFGSKINPGQIDITALANEVANKVGTEQVVGLDQSWQDLAPQRTLSVWYQNTTGKPIMVATTCSTTTAGGRTFGLNVNTTASATGAQGITFATVAQNASVSLPPVLIPNNYYYQCLLIGSFPGSGDTISNWFELRI